MLRRLGHRSLYAASASVVNLPDIRRQSPKPHSFSVHDLFVYARHMFLYVLYVLPPTPRKSKPQALNRKPDVHLRPRGLLHPSGKSDDHLVPLSPFY